MSPEIIKDWKQMAIQAPAIPWTSTTIVDLCAEVERLQAFVKTNSFEAGINCMARNCQAASKLIQSGEWPAGQFDFWLKAVLCDDSGGLQRHWLVPK